MLKKNELLLKVFFGSNTSSDIIIGHIQDHKKKLEEALRIFLGLEEWLLKQEPDDPNIKYWLITNDYGKKQFSSLIQWCDDSISLLNKSNVRRARIGFGFYACTILFIETEKSCKYP
ncbi:hypothetical protein A3842_03605 [Paenibacillus sp. P3E]|nr:hypothetical protein A3842_03605 [Paenibacillus sp. P3E]